MMMTMEATSFSDPLRERDLADRGIQAKVTINAGPPRRCIVEIDPADWGKLVDEAGQAIDFQVGYDHGRAEALAEIRALA